MQHLPSGPVTILFTDIEASTSLWDRHESAMRLAHQAHNETLSAVFDEHTGQVIKDKGDGFMVIFANPVAAVNAAVEGQRRLATTEWPNEVGEINVRMAINTGVVEPRDGDYYGPEVNRTARIEALAHGGQILVSETTRSLVAPHLAEDVGLIDLGPQRLRGVSGAERVHQVAADGLSSDFPALATAPRGVGLPATGTTFVGRQGEISDITDLIASGSRLVTLLGPGGIGKTRLAIESAHRLEGELAGGAHFADLSPLRAPDQVGHVIAEALGVHAEGSADVLSLVGEVVDAPTLLVVDNLEHVIESAASLGGLLDRTPFLTAIATSRQPLGLRSEHLYRVSPLATSANGDRSAAVELFYDRAAAQGAHLTDADRVAIESIIQRLDGLPLAIELVAPRTRLLSTSELDTMLADSLNTLVSTEADRPERHRTIRSAIDWSFGALDEDARRLFARLSALPAGATLAMAERVCCPDLGGSALDHLATLVDNSLVNPITGLPGGTRYSQLAPLREYGLERLHESGDYSPTMDRLLDFYVEHAPSIGDRMLNDSETDHELVADRSNLLAAMDWSLTADRVQEMAAATFAMWIHWFNGDRLAPLVSWVAQASGRISSPELDWLTGFLAFQAGDMDTVAIKMPAALDGFARADNDRGRASALLFGSIAAEDPSRAYAMLDEAFDLFPPDLAVGRYIALLFQSVVDFQTGDLEAALERRLQALAGIVERGFPVLEAWMHWNVALAQYGLGRHRESVNSLRRTFEYMAADAYQEGVASAAEGIAVLEIEADRPERALHLLGAAEAAFTRIGTVSWFESRHYVNEITAELRDNIGEVQYDTWLEQGRQLTFAELIDLGFEALLDLERA